MLLLKGGKREGRDTAMQLSRAVFPTFVSPSMGITIFTAGTARADRQRANVDKLVKGARAVLPDYSLPE